MSEEKKEVVKLENTSLAFKGNESSPYLTLKDDINEIGIPSLKMLEARVFWEIVSAMYNWGSTVKVFKFSHLINVCRLGHKTNDEMKDFLVEFSIKMKCGQYVLKKESDGSIDIDGFFSKFNINPKSGELRVQVSEDYQGYCNDLQRLIMYNKKELYGFTSKYTALLYQELIKYSDTGQLHIKPKVLMDRLGCPQSYNVALFNSKILNPSLEELEKSGYFKKISLIKDKKENAKGSPITCLHFYFTHVLTSKRIEEKQKKAQDNKNDNNKEDTND